MEITIAIVLTAVVSFAVTWRYLLPRLVDKSVSSIIHAFYAEEVEPMQLALPKYKEAIEKLMDDVDDLYSNGQYQKPRESFDKIDELPIRAANPKV